VIIGNSGLYHGFWISPGASRYRTSAGEPIFPAVRLALIRHVKSLAPENYHQLSPEWFDATDNHEAEIFWGIRYAGLNRITFEPQWFPLRQDDLWTTEGGPPRFRLIHGRLVNETLEDQQEHVRWIGMHKGGVWGIHGARVFFLAPQLSYTFEDIDDLRSEGDWLLAYGERQDTSDVGKSEIVSGDRVRPSIRYNRRTHELRIERNDYDWETSDPSTKSHRLFRSH
jgi:hypothetical protein